MGRKKGKSPYHKTEGPRTFITTKQAFAKLRSAERRSGKSQSDIITHCVLQVADLITKETFADATE